MISDERLKQLIECQNKWCAECELDDTEYLPSDGLWDTHNALTELAEARKLLREALPHLHHTGATHHQQCACSVKRRIEAVIRKELERKESPHHEQ